MIERRDTLLGLALVVLSVVHGLFLIGVYPPFKIVDEPAHFDDIQFRATHALEAPPRPMGSVDHVQSSDTSREQKELWKASQRYWRGRYLPDRLDVPEEQSLVRLTPLPDARTTDGQSVAARSPGFYYTLAAVIPYRIFERANVLRRVFALRVYSLLWGTLFVLFSFCAARVALRDRAMAFTTGLFVMLQPLAAQQTVAVTCDSAAMALCALVLWAQLVVVTRESGARSLCWWLTIALGTALALETKATTIALVPASVVLVARAVLAGRRRDVLVSIVAFAATWLACHLVCDHFAMPTAMKAGGLPRAVIPAAQGFGKFLSKLDEADVVELTRTGWTALSWLDVKMSVAWTDDLHAAAIVLWLALPAAMSLRWLFADRPRFFSDRAVALSALTTLAGLVTILHAEYLTRIDLHLKHTVTGRELLIVLPAAACVAGAALGSLVPRHFRTLLSGLVCAGVALLATGAATTMIASMYVD